MSKEYRNSFSRIHDVVHEHIHNDYSECECICSIDTVTCTEVQITYDAKIFIELHDQIKQFDLVWIFISLTRAQARDSYAY